MDPSRPLKQFKAHAGIVEAMVISPDGKQVATAGRDALVKTWDMETGRCLHQLKGHGGPATSLAFVGNDRLASASRDETIRLWDLETGEPGPVLEGHGDIVWAVLATADGRHLVSGSADETVKTWLLPEGRLLRTSKGHTGAISSMTISVDGRFFMTGSYDNSIRVWEVHSGRPIRKITGHAAAVRALGMVDNYRLVSASNDRTLRTWQWGTGKPLKTLAGHRGDVTCVTLDPDSGAIISGSWDATLRAWAPETGKSICIIETNCDAIASVAIAPGTGIVLSAGYDGNVSTWSLEAIRKGMEREEGQPSKKTGHAREPGPAEEGQDSSREILARVLEWERENGFEMTREEMGSELGLTPDEIDLVEGWGGAVQSYTKGDVPKIRAIADQVMIEYRHPSLYDLVVTMKLDPSLARKIGRYMLDEYGLDYFFRT